MTSYNFKSQNVKNTGSVSEKAWTWFMADLEKNRPAYIVDTAVSNFRQYGKYLISQYPQIKKYLEEYYVLEKSMMNWDVYVRKPEFRKLE